MSQRHAAFCALLVGALLFPSAPARADATADLQTFVRKAAPMTFADFAPLHGASISEGEWKAIGTFGPSISRCLIVDLDSMATLLGGTPGSSPYSSALQCDGARTPVSQTALIAWAVKTISPLLPGRTMKRYPATKSSQRSSVTWTNATGQTVQFIAFGTSDFKRHPRVGYVIDVEQLGPDSMATPTP